MIYHHVTDEVTYRADSPLTHGLDVDLPVGHLADQLDVLRRRYDVADLTTACSATPSGRRRLVITFDDAYASVARLAAPLLRQRGIPWVFFVNPNLLDNRTLAFDNAIAYVINTYGAAPLEAVAGAPFDGIANFIAVHGSRMRPQARQQFMDELVQRLGLDLQRVAEKAQLYLSTAELLTLVEEGVEIGNHTADHVHCRSLTASDAAEQIGGSAARLRQLTGSPVRSFAYPYGSADDATAVAREGVRRAGHDLAFFVRTRQNPSKGPAEALCRVAPRATRPAGLYVELELRPRLGALKQGAASRARTYAGAPS